MFVGDRTGGALRRSTALRAPRRSTLIRSPTGWSRGIVRHLRARLAGVLAVFAIGIALLFLPAPRWAVFETRIVSVTQIDRPAGVVFDYVTTPAHWPTWHPSSLAVSGAVDHPLDPGEE